MRGKATAMRDVLFGGLTGRIGDKEVNTYCRGNREVRHDLLAGQKIGEKVPLLDEGVGLDDDVDVDDDCPQADEIASLKARIAELEGKKKR